jgi:hypothetical protein
MYFVLMKFVNLIPFVSGPDIIKNERTINKFYSICILTLNITAPYNLASNMDLR